MVELNVAFRALMSQEPPEYGRLVLFGAGNTLELYRKSMERRKIDFDMIIDNDPAKQGTDGPSGKPIVSMDEYRREHARNDDLIAIVSTGRGRMDMVRESARDGRATMTLDRLMFLRDKDRVMNTLELLRDRTSQTTYKAAILARAGELGRIPFELYDPNPHYAIPEFLPEEAQSETFVDLGAYVGDTVEEHVKRSLGVFKRIYAFEPDKRNFAAMTKRIERLKAEWALPDGKIEPVKAAIGQTDGKVRIGSAVCGLGSHATEAGLQDNDTVPIVTLDSWFENQNDAVTHVKADIESFEHDMLLGARAVIRRDKPRLSICVYHGPADLYDIPLLVHELNPSYEIAIRHHMAKALSETILYAWIPENRD